MKLFMKSFKNLFQFTAIFGIALTLTGCATIFGDNTRNISVQSTPGTAQMRVEGETRGATPAVITLPTYIYGGKRIQLIKHGYQEQTLFINTKFQPCTLWNLLFWPGFLIDAATGNLVKIDPSQLNSHVNLTPTS